MTKVNCCVSMVIRESSEDYTLLVNASKGRSMPTNTLLTHLATHFRYYPAATIGTSV
jgi:hypothetical protein